MSEVQPAVSPGLRARHEALRDLLDRNGDLLELLAEIQLDLRLLVPGDPVVRTRTVQLLEATLLQVETLNILSGDRYRKLYEVHAGIESGIRRLLGEGRRRLLSDPRVLPLSTCRPAVQALVGGKAARLGELSARLPERVPEGFVVTTAAHARLLAHGQTGSRLRAVMKGLDLATDATRLGALAAEARGLVHEAPIPEEIRAAIRERASSLGGVRSWAVRSSAVGEDGPFSFAGQFETLLHVSHGELSDSWRRVVASTFSEHAMRYRLACGLFELATPMAVLFMPMVAARAAGVLYTRDPARPRRGTLLVSALQGLAPDLVGGRRDAETAFVSRNTLAVEERVPPPARDGGTSPILSDDALADLARLGLEAETVLGPGLDVEWAMEDSGRLRLLQARPLASVPTPKATAGKPSSSCLARGGLTIVGGRAVGAAAVGGTSARAEETPEGAILVVPQALPELGHLLPRIDGLVAEHGSLTGHLASLAREFGVPSVFGMPDAARKLVGERQVSLNATHCEVYRGEAWPPEERESRRRARELRAGTGSPLHRLVLHLDLTDPGRPSFRPKGCRSLHDIVRLCHEQGVAALFEGGEWRKGPAGVGSRRLQGGPLPDGAWVLDVGGGLPPGDTAAREVDPEQVVSRPFRALWRGMTTPGIAWSGRRNVDLRGFASVVSSSLTEADRGAESLGTASYFIVGAEYVNFNARMAYHFAMIDSVVGEASESNTVSFRFWGGGAGRAQRDLRAQFLAETLSRSGFTVERRGDLVTARLRRRPAAASEAGLELLGRLMGCARQLDMLLRSEAAVADFVEHFLSGRYEEFA
jgi:pyruvate,water dikinase